MTVFSKQNFYLKFLGFLTKKGYTIKAKKIFFNCFFSISKKKRLSTEYILFFIYKKLKSYVETKNLQIRKRTFIVPFGTTSKRRLYLILKWIINSALANKRKIPLSRKLYFELLKLLNKKYSKIVYNKKKIIRNAIKNRANSHYRW